MLQGQVLDVKLRRMARDEMADHVQMFELFTLVKEVAIGEDNPEGVAFVDELISLWTKMLLDDAVRDDTITANVRSMQDASIQQISVLQEGLSKMHAFAVERKKLVQTCSQAMLIVIMQEKEVQALKSDLNNKKADMLRKAKMILKREQDRAGNTILDCQKSMVRLQEDMNDKIRETEKKLASSEKSKAETLAQLATKKAECDEHVEKISKLMRELKGKTAELNGCQTELQKTSEALQQEASENEKLSKRAADAKVQIDDLSSKLKTLGTESIKLQDDLKKKAEELESLRAQLLKEQGKSGDLENELNNSSNELKGKTAELKSCQTELQKTSEALQQEVIESEKQSKRAADAQVQIDDLTSKLKTLGTESIKLQDDLQAKMTVELESLRAQLLKEQGKSGDLKDELNKSSKLVRDAEGAVRCLAVEICALKQELSLSKKSTLQFAKDRLEKERKAAVEQVRILHEQKGSLQNEMDSEVELIKVENKKLTRSVNTMAQTHEDHRNRIVSKIAHRLLQRLLWMCLSFWHSFTLTALRLRRKAALVVQKRLNGHISKSFASWCDLQKAQVILGTKSMRVLKRFTHRCQAGTWEKWVSQHTEEKRLKALTKKVLGRWTGDVLCKALNEWMKKGKENQRLRAVAGKIALGWTNQSLTLAWSTWSSSAHDAKKQRVLTKRIMMHWTKARLARAWETWSRLRSDEKRLKKAALVVLSRWTKQSLVACWNRWDALAPAKKRMKMAAMKVIKRWTQQCLVVAWNIWSSTVMKKKRMRNVLQKVSARWSRSFLSAAWKTWSSNASEMVGIQAVGRKVVARLQGQMTGAAFMRWQGKAGEEKKARQVAQKVVLRWEFVSKMKAFMKWEGAVEEGREQMAKSAEQASKDTLAQDLTKVTAELSKQVRQLCELEASHSKKIMEAAHLRGKLQDAEKRIDVIQQDVNCLVNETQVQKSAVLKLSGDRVSQLGKELRGLKPLLELERESRQSAEQQAQQLVSTMQLNFEFFCDIFSTGLFFDRMRILAACTE
jgi:hypothetical protein